MKSITVDLRTYQDVANMMRGSLVKSGTNKKGGIVICEYKEKTPEASAHYELRTYQENGRTRVVTFYSGGLTTETFEDCDNQSEK